MLNGELAVTYSKAITVAYRVSCEVITSSTYKEAKLSPYQAMEARRCNSVR
jgi:hypothetical protein